VNIRKLGVWFVGHWLLLELLSWTFGATQPPILSGMEMSITQEAVAMLSAWEGNRRSDVTLAIHHRIYGSVARESSPPVLV